MDVERTLLSKAIQEGQLQKVVRREIGPQHFVSQAVGMEPSTASVWEWVLSHMQRYRSAPSIDLFRRRWPGFIVLDSSDSFDAVLDEFIRVVKRRKAIESIRHLSSVVDDWEMVADIEVHFHEAAKELAGLVPTSSVIRYSESPERRAEYLRGLDGDGDFRISTMIPEFDRITGGGIQDYEVLVIEGFLNLGKSSFGVGQAAKAYFERDETPLFMTLEMEGTKLAQRWDAYALGVQYGAIKRLELGEGDLERWEKIGEKAADSRFEKDIIVIDDLHRPSSARIQSEVEKWDPSYVIVDPIDEVSAPNWCKSLYERQGYAIREIKSMARMMRKPFVVMVQAGREAEQEGATLGNVAGCVPLSAQILTREGWKSHDEVRVGDETIGYDQDLGCSRWTEVQKVFHYESQPTVEIGHHTWSAVVTPNHRWVGDARRTHMEDGKRRMHREPCFIETTNISGAHRLKLSAPFVQEETVGEQDAELVGWLWGDGSVYDNTGKSSVWGGRQYTELGGSPGFNMFIYQSKPHGLALLREVLRGVPCYEYVQERQEPGWYPKSTFRIQSSWAREMWSRVGLDHMTPVEFVLSLGPRGLEALLRGLWGAEGWMNGKCKIMSQNRNSEFCEAMILATYLGGYRPCISERRVIGNRTPNICIHFGGDVVTGQWLSTEQREVQDVWCVETELGSWTMRQGEHVMLTGNSIDIARKADIAVGLHATSQMQKQNKMRLTALKIRDDGGKGTTIDYFWDVANMVYRPWTPADAIPVQDVAPVA